MRRALAGWAACALSACAQEPPALDGAPNPETIGDCAFSCVWLFQQITEPPCQAWCPAVAACEPGDNGRVCASCGDLYDTFVRCQAAALYTTEDEPFSCPDVSAYSSPDEEMLLCLGYEV